jgi:hypothetical protein
LGKRLALDLPPAGGKLCEAFLEKRKARYYRAFSFDEKVSPQ